MGWDRPGAPEGEAICPGPHCTPLPDLSRRDWLTLLRLLWSYLGSGGRPRGQAGCEALGSLLRASRSPAFLSQPEWAGKQSSPCRWCYDCNAAKSIQLVAESFFKVMQSLWFTVRAALASTDCKDSASVGTMSIPKLPCFTPSSSKRHTHTQRARKSVQRRLGLEEKGVKPLKLYSLEVLPAAEKLKNKFS